MPHLTLEYSSNVGPRATLKTLLHDLHEVVGTTESVEIEKVKSRLLEHTDYFIGRDSSRRAFLHVTLAILPGRSHDLKKDLGERLHRQLVSRLREVVPSTINCSTTLEIREINETYFFRTAPPLPDH